MITDMTGKLFSLRGKERKTGPSSHLFIDKMTGRLWEFESGGAEPYFICRIPSWVVTDKNMNTKWEITGGFPWNYYWVFNADYGFRAKGGILAKYEKVGTGFNLIKEVSIADDIGFFKAYVTGFDIASGKIYYCGWGKEDDADMWSHRSFLLRYDTDLNLEADYFTGKFNWNADVGLCAYIGADNNYVYYHYIYTDFGDIEDIYVVRRTTGFGSSLSIDITSQHVLYSNFRADETHLYASRQRAVEAPDPDVEELCRMNKSFGGVEVLCPEEVDGTPLLDSEFVWAKASDDVHIIRINKSTGDKVIYEKNLYSGQWSVFKGAYFG